MFASFSKHCLLGLQSGWRVWEFLLFFVLCEGESLRLGALVAEIWERMELGRLSCSRGSQSPSKIMVSELWQILQWRHFFAFHIFNPFHNLHCHRWSQWIASSFWCGSPTNKVHIAELGFVIPIAKVGLSHVVATFGQMFLVFPHNPGDMELQ